MKRNLYTRRKALPRSELYNYLQASNVNNKNPAAPSIFIAIRNKTQWLEI
jgi:hypothetical protein